MGGFIVPPMPAELVAALKRQQGAVPGAPMGAGLPVNGRPPMTSPIVAQPPTGQPLPGASTNLGPTGANVMPATPGKVPPVTDDPSVPKGPAASSSTTGTTDELETRGMMSRLSPPSAAAPALPQTPNLSSYLDPALKQYQSDLSGYQQSDQANRLDPQQLRPKWWERLAGFALGATQLKDPSNAGNVASEVTNRRLNEATANRERALAPWTQRLQTDREGLPLAEAAERTAHEQGQLDLERYNAITNSDYKEAIAEVRDEVAKGNIEKAKDLLDQQQKALDEKTKHDAEWYQMQHALLDVRQQLADARDREVAKSKDHTSQANAAETTKANAITATEDKYRKAIKQLDLDYPPDKDGKETEEHKQARAGIEDAHTTDLQRAEDAYEAKGTEIGGTMPHQNVESWRSQPANAVPTAMGPKDEKPLSIDSKTNKQVPGGAPTIYKDAQGRRIGYYKSTGQWMLVPQSQGAK